jgi:hypothetical protein
VAKEWVPLTVLTQPTAATATANKAAKMIFFIWALMQPNLALPVKHRFHFQKTKNPEDKLRVLR